MPSMSSPMPPPSKEVEGLPSDLFKVDSYQFCGKTSLIIGTMLKIIIHVQEKFTVMMTRSSLSTWDRAMTVGHTCLLVYLISSNLEKNNLIQAPPFKLKLFSIKCLPMSTKDMHQLLIRLFCSILTPSRQ